MQPTVSKTFGDNKNFKTDSYKKIKIIAENWNVDCLGHGMLINLLQ